MIKVEIGRDEDPINPREDACLGTMVCWHKRYRLGEKHGYETPQDFKAEWNDANALILPLGLLDHSGITMKVGTRFASDPGGWDSGQVGYIYVSHEAIAKEYGKVNETTLEKARAVLVGEVETYDQYLRGDVYYYTVKKTTVCKHCWATKTDTLDSCGGFYGHDARTNGMLENISKKYRKQLLEAKVS